MDNISYGIQKQISGDFDTVLAKVKEELTNEGFGVLTEINVADTFKKKLNIEFNRYIILGACHPPSAYNVLLKEPQIGLLLPCNVIVYQSKNMVTVSAIRPTIAMEIVDNEEIASTAMEIEGKLQRVIDKI